MTNNSHRYRLDLGERAYDIHIESGCLHHIGNAMNDNFGQPSRTMIVSNETVAPLYLKSVESSLHKAGWQTSSCILADGERYKNMASWSQLMDALMQSKLSRHEPIIALGGGVIGDMTGFAASCYRRGVPFVQVPTTLLAQVDSSVGGKTAINHPHGKNMIGSFYQPKLVWIDPNVLKTLPVRELRAGIAELIKYGLIRDADFFHWLQENIHLLLALDTEALAKVIHTSCRHKAEVVVADERESGQRALLNLGHTFGHAIESMTHYTKYLHGEAVALGTLLATRLSEQAGFARPGLETSIRDLYLQVGLPVDIPQFSSEAWLDSMGHDKKNIGNRIRYILMHEIGDAFIAEGIDNDAIHALISSYLPPHS
ncbi:MAG: 3-dehydroquinate synthase [Mariprofundaceae bacterium]